MKKEKEIYPEKDHLIEEWQYEEIGKSLDEDYGKNYDIGPGNGAYESWSDYWSDRL